MITAACPRVYPLGTAAILPDMNLLIVCTDRTAKKYDGRWDIFMDNYDEALKFGKQKQKIVIFKNL